jgi:tetratricopeptide (TPR) repeat protein
LPAGGPRAPATTPDRGTPAARGAQGGQTGALPVTKPAARRAPTAASARAQEDKVPAAPIAINPPTLMVDPQIERAYDAFQKGDLTTARSQYQAALQREPANRDVLLGLAAVDIRTRNFESAESRYLKILEADPRDALAMAGLIALRGQTDPLQSESRLKSLIAANPDSAHLHFALGNQYAAMVRWPEAQSAYFKAYSLDPDNPDFSFNLAVSLDQLRQGKLALEYYRRALALVNTRPAGFDRNQVSARITELSH